mmetsp:Transcript_17823/g.55939  ORF Transcript_17823/g.55939 Transcript_17823/m.55939 type:complete len:211 (-) Transcript_17823:167-799(-)
MQEARDEHVAGAGAVAHGGLSGQGPRVTCNGAVLAEAAMAARERRLSCSHGSLAEVDLRALACQQQRATGAPRGHDEGRAGELVQDCGEGSGQAGGSRPRLRKGGVAEDGVAEREHPVEPWPLPLHVHGDADAAPLARRLCQLHGPFWMPPVEVQQPHTRTQKAGTRLCSAVGARGKELLDLLCRELLCHRRVDARPSLPSAVHKHCGEG